MRDDISSRRHANFRVGEDWGMGDSNAKIPPSSIFNPASTPAHEIDTVAFFVISITAVIFVIVAGCSPTA